jgi:hypothetical protein
VIYDLKLSFLLITFHILKNESLLSDTYLKVVTVSDYFSNTEI